VSGEINGPSNRAPAAAAIGRQPLAGLSNIKVWNALKTDQTDILAFRVINRSLIAATIRPTA